MTLSSPQQQYSELISLTKEFIEQEYNITVPIQTTTPPSATIPATASKAPIEKPVAIQKKSFTLEKKPTPRLSHKPKKTTEFTLDNTTAAGNDMFADVRDLFTQVAPSISITNTLPNDTIATIPDVAIISFGKNHEEIEFLDNVAKATVERLTSAKVITPDIITKSWGWNTFLGCGKVKLIIGDKESIIAIPELARIYKDNEPLDYLGNVKYFPLNKISDYPNNKTLKATLWNTLCQMFRKQ